MLQQNSEYRSNDLLKQCICWMQKEMQSPFAYDADQHFDTNIKWVSFILGWIPLCTENSLQKQPFLLTPLHWGRFCDDERLQLRDRNSIPMT